MPAAIDITDQRFGQLIAKEPIHRTMSGGTKRKFWRCVCDCGKETFAQAHTLRSGHTTSCGHDRMKNMHAAAHKAKRVHGRSRGDKTWRAWDGMFARCYTPKNPSYHRYGGRGITVCERWSEKGGQGFLNFLEDMGDPPTTKHSIDRIDTNGNYTPENCRWATPRQQANNRTNNVYYTQGGLTMTVSEWARHLGIHRDALAWRIKHWGPEKAISQ